MNTCTENVFIFSDFVLVVGLVVWCCCFCSIDYYSNTSTKYCFPCACMYYSKGTISLYKKILRIKVILRHLIWENVDQVPPLYKMCILMLWMASARYYIHKKNKKIEKINIGGKLLPLLKKIKNMLGQNLCSFLGDFFWIAKNSRSKTQMHFLLA